MKTIGLIGGMSWESSAAYYQIINQTVKERLGGLHSANCLLYSLDFSPIEKQQSAGQWQQIADTLAKAAASLEKAGADFVLLCSNTVHKVAADVERHISVPLVHIADVTAAAVRARGIGKVGLLGTRFTMEEDFYKGRLRENGLEVITPGAGQRAAIDRIIYQELCLGQIKEVSKAEYLKIMAELAAAGAEGIILGCTEIGLLVQQKDTAVPLFDTTFIHAERAALLALTPDAPAV